MKSFKRYKSLFLNIAGLNRPVDFPEPTTAQCVDKIVTREFGFLLERVRSKPDSREKPLHHTHVGLKVIATSDKNPAAMPVSVLVVEDDLGMRVSIEESLGDEGYEPYCVGSYPEALSLADKYQFKVLVTDVRLPGFEKDKDGIDGLLMLKQKQPHLKSLVITGFAGQDGVKKAFKNQVDDYLTKPFSFVALIKAVDRLAYPNKLVKYCDSILQSTPVKGLLAIASSFFQKSKTAKVDRAREKAFWGLLMAIRSGECNAGTANATFCALSRTDEQYRQYYENPSKDLSQDLLARYTEIYQNLAELVNTGMVKIGGERMEPTEFRKLYNLVQQGLITLDEFQLATALRDIEPDKLLMTPELAQLREKIWGPST